MLKAIGKFIDTLPLRTLFSQEERCADTIVIETDRYYNGYDLAGYTFLMRGVTPSGGETEQMLEKTQSSQRSSLIGGIACGVIGLILIVVGIVR